MGEGEGEGAIELSNVFSELADALGVERPNPQGSTIAYEFDYSMDPQKIPAMIRIYTVSLGSLLFKGEAQFYVQ